tara:strand:+ start:703 stop:951 length:249 start_codon:yes stop_codon:yes gene_type:complete
MSYDILPTEEFEKSFLKLDSNIRSRIKRKFEEIAENPERYKHMSPPMNDFCRIRVEKLRILFSYDVQKQELYPERIIFGHRY